MANNRMYLVHMPTRIGCYIGKTMAQGWYDAQSPHRLFEHLCDIREYSDDFALVMESAGNYSLETNGARPIGDGLLQFDELRMKIPKPGLPEETT